jgi:hypothetical protein
VTGTRDPSCLQPGEVGQWLGAACVWVALGGGKVYWVSLDESVLTVQAAFGPFQAQVEWSPCR